MQKATSIAILLILIFRASVAIDEECSSCSHQPEAMHPMTVQDEINKHIDSSRQLQSRKLLVDFTLDYDISGPNTRHDPRRGKPGIGGRN